jgi:hypothetical protein
MTDSHDIARGDERYGLFSKLLRYEYRSALGLTFNISYFEGISESSSFMKIEYYGQTVHLNQADAGKVLNALQEALLHKLEEKDSGRVVSIEEAAKINKVLEDALDGKMDEKTSGPLFEQFKKDQQNARDMLR